MNEVMIDNSKIENMIYEIRGKHVMFNSEVSATKWHRVKSLIYLTLRVFIKLMLFYQY